MLTPDEPSSYYHDGSKFALGYKNPWYLKKAQILTNGLYHTPDPTNEKRLLVSVFDSEETIEHAKENRIIHLESRLRIEVNEYKKDYVSLEKKVDNSPERIKQFEIENDRLLKAVWFSDIMSVALHAQSASLCKHNMNDMSHTSAESENVKLKETIQRN
ncbi:hypothetical protein Tco_1267642 [Tanacetum coccineum]